MYSGKHSQFQVPLTECLPMYFEMSYGIPIPFHGFLPSLRIYPYREGFKPKV